MANSIGVLKRMRPPHIVPIQLKNFTPVGTAMSIDSPAKNGRSTAPVVNMWCAHTPTDRRRWRSWRRRCRCTRTPGGRENTGITSVTTPKYGSTRMYTSGWPKNQNRCCHSIGAPPASASKMWAPEMPVGEQHGAGAR